MQGGFHLIITELQNAKMNKVIQLLSETQSLENYWSKMYQNSLNVLSVYRVQGTVPGVSDERIWWDSTF